MKKGDFIIHTDIDEENKNDIYLTVIQSNGYAMGKISIYDNFPENGDRIGMISSIHTEERYRRQGWGNKILSILEEIGKMRSVTIFELAAHQWMVEWYQRHGYVIYSTYDDSDYVGMRKII